jgi:type I restriction enzyme S subunit
MSVRPYPEYRYSGIDWLGQLPSGWSLRRAKQFILHIEQGWSPQCESAPVTSDDEWGVLKVGCVNGGRFNPNENKSLPIDLEPVPELGLVSGDVLISRANTRELVGSACYLDASYPNLMICDKIYRLRLDHNILLPQLFSIYLASMEARSQIELAASGASQSMVNIAQSTIMEMPVPIPSAFEQFAILEFVDRETGKIDALVAEQERLMALLKEKRQAVISTVTTQGLNSEAPITDTDLVWPSKIPSHWEILPLTRVVDQFVDYRGATPNKVDDGVPLITATQIKEGRIDHSLDPVFISHEEYASRMTRGFPAIGDVLLTTEAPLGEVAQIEDTMVAPGQRMVLMKVDLKKIRQKYLFLHFRADFGRHQLTMRGTGSTASGIRSDRLRASLVLVPPLDEQDQIIAHVAKVFETFAGLDKQLELQVDLLKERRAALISAAVTGKIDVRGLAGDQAQAA